MPRVLPLVLALAGCALRPDPCQSAYVPTLAGGTHVAADPGCELSGEWAGRWGGLRDSRLVVESSDGRMATVVYGIAPYAGQPGGVDRSSAGVVHPGGLGFGRNPVTFAFDLVGDELVGSYSVDGEVASRIAMHRCGPGSPPPAVPFPIAVAAILLGSYLIPAALALGIARWLRVERRWLGIGAFTWLVVSPLLFGVPMAAGMAAGPLAWAVALAFTAGIAEETSRFLVYRRQPDLTRQAALVAGLAHGTIEAFVLGIGAPAGFAVTRPILVLGHAALASLVWRAVADRPGWLAVAIAAHVLIDLCAFAVPAASGLVLPIAMSLAVFAVAQMVTDRPAATVSTDRPGNPLPHESTHGVLDFRAADSWGLGFPDPAVWSGRRTRHAARMAVRSFPPPATTEIRGPMGPPEGKSRGDESSHRPADFPRPVAHPDRIRGSRLTIHH